METAWASYRNAKLLGRDRLWRDGMVKPLKRLGIDVNLGSKWELVDRYLGPFIGQRSFRSAKWLTVSIALAEILADLRPDVFQDETDMAHNWIVAEEAVPRLQKVMRAQQREHGGETTRKPIDGIAERKNQQQDRGDECTGIGHIAPREG